MDASRADSIRNVIANRQQQAFVGREDQIAQFTQNLALPFDNGARKFIFNIYGPGGVGKTSLARKFKQICEARSSITAWTDESDPDLPAVMAQLARQIAERGGDFRNFTERYRVFRQKRQEVGADPEAPKGLGAFLGRTLVKGGFVLARSVPAAGALVDLVDEEQVADQAGELVEYLQKRLKNKDDVALLLTPTQVLTPFFLQGVRGAATGTGIALFFDTYERTGGYLDEWLRQLLGQRSESLPVESLMVIAGRDKLNMIQWSPFAPLVAQVLLEPFTEKETREYLERQQVTDERLIQAILQRSEGLPILVAMMAFEHQGDADGIGDLSGTAVDLFLEGVDDPQRRQIAIDAALPRRINRDILEILAGPLDSASLFDWLRNSPFVEEREKGWVYHEIVRAQMLRYKYRESPGGWAALHSRLAEYYEQLNEAVGLDEESKWRNPEWQNGALEGLYHRLCQAPRPQLSMALNGFVHALRWAKSQSNFAKRWAETLQAAGDDSEAGDLRKWGDLLANGLRDYDEEKYDRVIPMFTALLSHSGLEAQMRPTVLDWRGHVYYMAARYSEAETDLKEALTTSSAEDAEHWIELGSVHMALNANEEALADLTRAIDLLSNLDRETQVIRNLDRALTRRGVVFKTTERYEEAFRDFDRAVDLNPQYFWAFYERGDLKQQLTSYESALDDFTQAININSRYAAAYAGRGVTRRMLGNLPGAIRDLDSAIKLNLDEDWVLAERGEAHRLKGDYAQARADFDQALLKNPQLDWAIAKRRMLPDTPP